MSPARSLALSPKLSLETIQVHCREGNQMNDNAAVRSSLLGGLIAAVIWMIIATLNEASKSAVIGLGLALLAFTFVVSMVISRMTRRNRGGPQ